MRSGWMGAALALAMVVPLGAQEAAAPSLLPPGEAGTPLYVEGKILGPGGPVAGAAMYVYQTDARGIYSNEVNDDNTRPRLKARFQTGPDGAFAFRTIMPGQYPRSGPPAHIHLEVTPAGRSVERYEIVFEGDSRIGFTSGSTHVHGIGAGSGLDAVAGCDLEEESTTGAAGSGSGVGTTTGATGSAV